MKRIAVHWLFLPVEDRLLPYQVVEIDEQGTAARWYAFSHEQAATEWWGGLLVLAPAAPRLLPTDDFTTFRQRTAASFAAVRCRPLPLQAYHIAPFEAAALRLVPASRLIRISGKR